MKEQLRQERRGRIDDLYRGEILDAAVAVLAAKGYHDSTMQEIAERVGMAVGSLYKFFPGKSELYAALVKRFARTYRAFLDRALDEVDGEVAKIRHYVPRKGEFFHDNHRMARVYFGETRGQDFSLSAGMDADSRHLFDEFRERLARVFQKGMDEGLFAHGDPYYRAVALQSLTNAFLFLWLRDPAQHTYLEQVDTIVSLVLDGATGPAPERARSAHVAMSEMAAAGDG